MENNFEYCDDCGTVASAQKETQRESATLHSDDNDDDRSDIRKFLWGSFIAFVIAFPLLGYFLGGVVIALIFGFLGVLVFCMLEQLTH